MGKPLTASVTVPLTIPEAAIISGATATPTSAVVLNAIECAIGPVSGLGTNTAPYPLALVLAAPATVPSTSTLPAVEAGNLSNRNTTLPTPLVLEGATIALGMFLTSVSASNVSQALRRLVRPSSLKSPVPGTGAEKLRKK